MDDTLLKLALSAAVPLWIEELKNKPWDELQAMAEYAAQVVASKGDRLMFRGKKKGESAAAFNALAKGIAILSFAPGGVTVFGEHYEAKHGGAP
jgi:hypothetical protein